MPVLQPVPRQAAPQVGFWWASPSDAQLRSRGPQLTLQEKPSDDASPADPAAEAEATEAAQVAWPEATPVQPGGAPTDTSVGPKEGFDPRVVLYVGLSAPAPAIFTQEGTE